MLYTHTYTYTLSYKVLILLLFIIYLHLLRIKRCRLPGARFRGTTVFNYYYHITYGPACDPYIFYIIRTCIIYFSKFIYHPFPELDCGCLFARRGTILRCTQYIRVYWFIVVVLNADANDKSLIIIVIIMVMIMMIIQF